MKKNVGIKIVLSLLSFLAGTTYAKYRSETKTTKSVDNQISYEAQTQEVQEQGLFYMSELQEDEQLEVYHIDEYNDDEEETEVESEIIDTENNQTIEEEKETIENKVTEEKTTSIEKNETVSAKLDKITVIGLNTHGLIYLKFDKNVNVVNAPNVTIKVNGNTLEAYCISTKYSNSKEYTYKVIYGQLDVFESGKMYIDISGGKIVDSSDNNSLVDYTKKDYYVGTLKSYSIIETYEDVVNGNLGDMDLDGVVDSTDASTILRIHSKLATGRELTIEEKEQMARGDINKDGYVNQIDANLALTYYADNSTGMSNDNHRQVAKCDVNKDNRVNIEDYNLIKAAMSSSYNRKYDLNSDGKVDKQDINFLKETLKKYGKR